MNSGELRLGDVRLDHSTGELLLEDGRPAPLRNKSREVLNFLLENRGRTVTKDEVIGAVWPGAIASDDSLVQCIADIRRVIGEGAKRIVQTVPRQGYRLQLPDVADASGAPDPPAARGRWGWSALVGGTLLAGAAAWSLWPGAAVAPPPTAEGAPVAGRHALPGTSNTEAYLEVLKGRASANLFDRDESLVAERHFRRAIALDPAYARAYAELGTLFAVRFENDWTVLEQEDRDKALYYARTAVDLDPDLWLGHYALGRLQSVLGNLDEAEAHLRRAMTLQPEDEDARAYFATVKIFQGEPAAALEILEPTVKSHPNPPYWYFLSLGNANYALGRLPEAERALLSCRRMAPGSPYCLRFLVAAYAEMGRLEEARAARDVYAALGFDPSPEAMAALMSFQVPGDRQRLIEAYRSIGPHR